jgi:hypothetical protein
MLCSRWNLHISIKITRVLNEQIYYTTTQRHNHIKNGQLFHVTYSSLTSTLKNIFRCKNYNLRETKSEKREHK